MVKRLKQRSFDPNSSPRESFDYNHGMTTKNTPSNVRFEAQEFGDQTAYIGTLEDVHDGVSLYFLLAEGTSFRKAEDIAKFLNQNITGVKLRFR
jgi:hypothetical protein